MAHFRNQPRSGISRRNAKPVRRTPGNITKLVKQFLRVVVLLSLVGLGWMAWGPMRAVKLENLFPLEQVRVVGDFENIDVGKLQKIVLPDIIGGYFYQDLGQIEGAIRSIAWIDRVRLARIWPDVLEVDITEQKAVARWGDKALLNPRGERFTPDEIETFADLPVIYGPSGMENYLLEMLNTLNQKLEPKGVKVASLDLSKRMAWVVKLNNGLEIHFGRQEPVKLLERFLGLVPKLGEEVFSQLKRVDLRYPNGFAVVWKSAEEINGGNGPVSQLNGNASNLALEN